MYKSIKILLISFELFMFLSIVNGLHPQKNEYRQYDLLDGTWTFVREPINSYGIGLANSWHLLDLSTFSNATVMPVPSAYNELFNDNNIYNHIGWVWYQTKYTPSYKDASSRLFLRFESAHYIAVVFLDSTLIGNHTGGHLPFEFEVSLVFGRPNVQGGPEKMALRNFLFSVIWVIFLSHRVITVAINNTLSQETIPTAKFEYKKPDSDFGYSMYPDGFFEFTPDFDFFNYAGILRSVYLLKFHQVFISDLRIIADDQGFLSYTITTNPMNNSYNPLVTVKSLKTNNVVYTGYGFNNSVQLQNVDLWWPKGYGDANLYLLEATLLNNASEIVDIYRETFGFRKFSVSSNNILINGKIFYCFGFNMHEDFDIIGRGYNPVVMHKDLNTLEWMNANCYRTSQYPYAEERMYEADRRGIVTIVEAPATLLHHFTPVLQNLHAQMLTEMIARDKNHPSAMAWLLGNEPSSWINTSRPYFTYLVNLTKQLDSTRLVMTVLDNYDADTELIADLFDLVGLNRYFGWYQDMGYLDIVTNELIINLLRWRTKFGKPTMLSEYGAETIVGLTREPGTDFTFQYQNALVKRVHAALDVLRATGNVTGEMMWNFADFMTDQTTSRVGGFNHKGALTRNRQPKPVAYILQERYGMLMQYYSINATTTTTPTVQVSSSEAPTTTPSQFSSSKQLIYANSTTLSSVSASVISTLVNTNFSSTTSSNGVLCDKVAYSFLLYIIFIIQFYCF